jgi:hypothetical protein
VQSLKALLAVDHTLFGRQENHSSSLFENMGWVPNLIILNLQSLVTYLAMMDASSSDLFCDKAAQLYAWIRCANGEATLELVEKPDHQMRIIKKKQECGYHTQVV